jgi:hypothetical protein
MNKEIIEQAINNAKKKTNIAFVDDITYKKLVNACKASGYTYLESLIIAELSSMTARQQK